MTKTDPVRRTGVSRTRCCLYVPGLACILFVAFLLPSLLAPETAQAQSSALAPSTSGPRAEVVDGVPLVPTTKAQRGECQRFADYLKRPVPCPGLLPEPIPIPPTSTACFGEVGALSEASCGPAVIEVTGGVGGASFLLSQSNFQVPASYVGVTFEQYNGAVVPDTSVDGGPLGHFVFTADRGRPQLPSYCSRMSVAKTNRVHGAVTMLYQCSDASTAPGVLELIKGHDLLVWDDAGVTTEVSFHGHSQVNVDLDKAVANATVLVTPRKR
jgi:hypothetical protein